MSDPKTECEMLIGALLPFAEQMLREHGEFYPYAATMSLSDECAMAAIAEDGEEPSPSELITKYKELFRSESESGEFKATAIVYMGLTMPPGKPEQQNTVICAVEHRDGFCAKVCFPYTLDASRNLEMLEPFATAADSEIFDNK